MSQYGFFFDQSRCHNCHACTLACRSWNNIRPGPVKWMRVFRWEKGAFPYVKLYSAAVPCYHCEKPICIDVSNGGLFKEEKYGAVLIDPVKGNDLREAARLCPYGAIVFESDVPEAKASKCTMCIDRLEQGLQPVCVMACPTRAFDFGPLGELQKKYGTNRDLEDFPSSSLAEPAVVFKPRREKKKLIPYNSDRALELLSKRPGDLPQVFSSPKDVTEIPRGLVGTDRLKLKPSNTNEVLRLTKNDMG